MDNHVEATRLLNAYPELRSASWMGTEPILHFLAIENFPDGVRFCIQSGFDPNQPEDELGTTPLHYACVLGYREVALVLLQHGADPNAQSEIYDNPIHCCVGNGHAEVLDLLIVHKADPRYTTDLQETVFDNWPDDATRQTALAAVLDKHGIRRTTNLDG